MTILRFRALIWLLVAAVILVGLSASAGVLRWSPLTRLLGEATPETDRTALQGVECLGRVDVDGGLLELAPTRAGRVVSLPFREGDVASVGAVLLRLDEQPARLKIQQARAAQEAARNHPSRVAGQQALAAAAWSRVTAAREELHRKERQFDLNLISKEERGFAREEVKALESLARAEEKRLEAMRAEDPQLRVKLATSEVTRAKALLAEAQYELEQCAIVAPESGRLLRVRCGLGEVVSPQSAVLVFAPERPRFVRVEVEQELIHLVEVGQPAVVRDEMNPEWSWKGRVSRISEWYSNSPTIPRRMARFTDMPTVECVIELDPGHPPLRIGQRMTVQLGSAVSIPSSGHR